MTARYMPSIIRTAPTPTIANKSRQNAIASAGASLNLVNMAPKAKLMTPTNKKIFGYSRERDFSSDSPKLLLKV